MPVRLSRRLGIAALLAAAVAPPAFAQFKLGGSSTGPGAAAPATPAAAAAPAAEDPKVTKLLDFLEKEYGTLFAKSKDRVAKSLMAVCLNRLPRNGPTKALLEMAKKEADPLVRAVAWECLLSRAPSLGMDQYGQLMDVTYSLAQTDTLRGQLRVGALELLAVSPPTRKNKELLTQIYARCDSRNPADDDVIDGVGKVVGIWRSADLVEHFIGRLTTLDEAFRAYRVLYAAGSPVTPDKIQMDLGDRKCIAALQADHVAWWNADKAKWVESKVSLEDAPWRQLVPHLISAPMPLASVNADDKSWRRDLELRRPSLKSFDVNFLVDVSGSMDPALAWLRKDVKAMMNGLGVVSLEPRIGLTFYRDRGDAFVTKLVNLTGNANQLLEALARMDCAGGGDIPEAVLAAMTDALQKNPWSTSTSGRKVVVLVADAPGHPEEQTAAVDMVKQAAERGFRVHAVKLQSSYAPADQSGLDALAVAGKGISIPAPAAELTEAALRKTPTVGLSRGRPTLPVPPAEGTRPAYVPPAYTPPVAAAARNPDEPFIPAAGPVGRRVLTTVLVDAISPAYADRVEPMAAVLWELLQEPSTEKQPPFGPVAKVDTSRMRNDTATMRNDSKVKPKGPQDR